MLRTVIVVSAGLALLCLVAGYILLNQPPSAFFSARALTSLVAGIGLIFLAILLERLAVSLAFAHSRRETSWFWSVALLALCLLMGLDSLFFVLRVQGQMPHSWSLLSLPPEEVLPPLEALLFAPVALVYGAHHSSARRSVAQHRVGHSAVASAGSVASSAPVEVVPVEAARHAMS